MRRERENSKNNELKSQIKSGKIIKKREFWGVCGVLFIKLRNLQMSQDSEEIKTIEQWKWSEMQGLELVSAPPSDPFKTNPSTPTPTTTTNNTHLREQQEKPQQQSQAEAQAYQESVGERREMETSSSSSETKKDGSNNGSGGSGEKPGDLPSVGFGELFRFADGLDYVLMGIGSLGAFVHGCSLPLFLRFFADLVNSFGSNANNMDKMMQEVLKVIHLKPQFSFFIKRMNFHQKSCKVSCVFDL